MGQFHGTRMEQQKAIEYFEWFGWGVDALLYFGGPCLSLLVSTVLQLVIVGAGLWFLANLHHAI